MASRSTVVPFQENEFELISLISLQDSASHSSYPPSCSSTLFELKGKLHPRMARESET